MKKYLLLFMLLLGACTPVIQSDSRPLNTSSFQTAKTDEQLGIQRGDDMYSQVHTVNLKRLNKTPISLTEVFYAERPRGKTIQAISLDAGKVTFSIQTEDHQGVLYHDAGNYYFSAKVGQVYRLIYHNNSSNTYEIVASVDGLDVINGQSASQYHPGHILQPRSEITIEGFRKDNSTIATFVFSKPEVAANNPIGTEQNIGVIATAIYQLQNLE